MKYRLAAVAAFAFLMGCSSQPEQVAQPEVSQVEINKGVVARYLEALGKPEFQQLSEEILAPNHRQARTEFENLRYNAMGDSTLMEGSLPEDQAIANRTNTITMLIGEGDMVAARIRVQGTHVGKLYGVPASNKDFWFDEVGVFRLADGKITETWLLGNDGRFLIEVGEKLPARADGRIIPPPAEIEAYPGDHWVAELSASGDESQQTRNKITMGKYNADRFRGGRTTPIPRLYDEYLHSGNQVTVDLIKEIEKTTGQKVPGSFLAGWSGRSDLIINFIAEENTVLMQFQLNALNSGTFYTIPPTGKQIRSWEVCIAEFDGDKWVSAWFFGDDLGLYLKLGTEEALSFFFDDVSVPRQ